jgi:hypothetical protein
MGASPWWAKHLRGFDMAMAEVGDRYIDLHWAGRDRNWELAKYHAEKIRVAIANGIERRPKRAASATMIGGALDVLEEAIAAKDAGLFDERFTALTATCNACHHAEKVAFFVVRAPEVRISPTDPAGGDGK